MILSSLFLLANFAVHVPCSGENVCDSFLRDDVKPKDFERLTAKARAGRTHLASSGTGFFITEDGFLLTNHHVIKDASEIVIVQKGTAYYADVRAKSSKVDLALLKINLFPRATNGVISVNGVPRVPALSFAEHCEVGQTVYVVGFPETNLLGHEAKLSRGIVNSVSGYRDRTDLLQMDAAITHGNSGGPVVDERGDVLGVACSGIGLTGGNYNYAIRYDAVRNFLSRWTKVCSSASVRKLVATELAKQTIRATVLVLVYKEGACERITSTEVDDSETMARERETEIKKAILDARLCKLKRDWQTLKSITDAILGRVGDYEDARELNELACDELGLHLTIIAEVDGHEVDASVKPIVGFKEDAVQCGRPVALFDVAARHGFPVEAKLTYEDADWIWGGELKCRYTWRGTKVIRVALKHTGKK